MFVDDFKTVEMILFSRSTNTRSRTVRAPKAAVTATPRYPVARSCETHSPISFSQVKKKGRPAGDDLFGNFKLTDFSKRVTIVKHLTRSVPRWLPALFLASSVLKLGCFLLALRPFRSMCPLSPNLNNVRRILIFLSESISGVHVFVCLFQFRILSQFSKFSFVFVFSCFSPFVFSDGMHRRCIGGAKGL